MNVTFYAGEDALWDGDLPAAPAKDETVWFKGPYFTDTHPYKVSDVHWSFVTRARSGRDVLLSVDVFVRPYTDDELDEAGVA